MAYLDMAKERGTASMASKPQKDDDDNFSNGDQPETSTPRDPQVAIGTMETL